MFRLENAGRDAPLVVGGLGQKQPLFFAQLAQEGLEVLFEVLLHGLDQFGLARDGLGQPQPLGDSPEIVRSELIQQFGQCHGLAPSRGGI